MAEIYEISTDNYIQGDVDYNQFFHPNVCHICKSRDMNLISCDRCDMISYCSEYHKKLHRPEHEDICSFIMRFINEDPNWYTHRIYFEDWFKVQENLVLIAQMALGRKLKTYEVQMIMSAKSCFICHRRHNLFTCEKCISVNYCADHISEIFLHKATCNDLALCLDLDILFLQEISRGAAHVKFNNFPDNKRAFNDMISFCKQYYEYLNETGIGDFNVYTFTDYISGPLSLCYGLQSTNLLLLKNITHNFIVHIIAPDYVDKCNFPAWELFLHLLNSKCNLIIVMIGVKLQHENNEYNVCSHCKAANKKIIIESFTTLYRNYVNHTYYKRPNVIAIFQAEHSYGESWLDSIRAIQAQKCPLFITTISQFKAHYDIIKVKQALNASVQPILCTENYFSSCRPYRNFEDGYVFFRNSYLVVYKDLGDSSDQNVISV